MKIVGGIICRDDLELCSDGIDILNAKKKSTFLHRFRKKRNFWKQHKYEEQFLGHEKGKRWLGTHNFIKTKRREKHD